MDWDKLRIFHAVAEAGSFTRAGEGLRLSQSAVSRQISALEHSLDVTLFHRHARGLVLTEQGEMLHHTTTDMHHRLSVVEGQLTDTEELPAGNLTITVSNFIGSTWLTTRLVEFQELYPQIQLNIIFEDRALNIAMREADAGIRLRKPRQADLIQRHLGQIHFHMCASREYLKKYGKPKTREDLKEHHLLGYPEHIPVPFDHPNWLFELAGVTPHRDYNLLTINSVYGLYKAAITGAGIAVLPDYIIKGHMELDVILPGLQRPPLDMYFVYAPERKNSKRIELFRDFLVKHLRTTPLSVKFA